MKNPFTAFTYPHHQTEKFVKPKVSRGIMPIETLATSAPISKATVQENTLHQKNYFRKVTQKISTVNFNQPQANHTWYFVSVAKMQHHINYLQMLSALLAQHLPLGNAHLWQVASLDKGILCIAVQNHTVASQLKYIQAQVLNDIQQLEQFSSVQKLKVIVASQYQPKQAYHPTIAPLTDNIKQIINNAANQIKDEHLSQSLRRLASKV